jgi:DNA modification methylase
MCYTWETGNKNHSAAFPEELPAWFIKLFTAPGDIVLDPFLGSGTTIVAALRLGRTAIGIELRREYVSLAHQRIKKLELKTGDKVIALRRKA